MKALTEEQLWAVLEVMFRKRSGICLALDYLAEKELVDRAGRYTNNPVTAAIHREVRRTGNGGWLWDVPTHNTIDRERVAFLQRERERWEREVAKAAAKSAAKPKRKSKKGKKK